MALKPCPDCGQTVSNKAVACPKCGRPIKGPRDPSFLIVCCFVLLFLAGIGVWFVVESVKENDRRQAAAELLARIADPKSEIRQSAAKRTEDSPKRVQAKMLREIELFLTWHEYGKPVSVEDLPDWRKGKRQQVVFDTDRRMQFYIKGEGVVTVYEIDALDGRTKIWGDDL